MQETIAILTGHPAANASRPASLCRASGANRNKKEGRCHGDNFAIEPGNLQEQEQMRAGHD